LYNFKLIDQLDSRAIAILSTVDGYLSAISWTISLQ
jgi:hypothetical protein